MAEYWVEVADDFEIVCPFEGKPWCGKECQECKDEKGKLTHELVVYVEGETLVDIEAPDPAEMM